MKHHNARTTMTYREIAVSSSATKISLTEGMNGKEYMMISNLGSKSCYIGDSTVTSTSGYSIRPFAAYDFGACTPLFNFYVVTGGTDTTILGVFET